MHTVSPPLFFSQHNLKDATLRFTAHYEDETCFLVKTKNQSSAEENMRVRQIKGVYYKDAIFFSSKGFIYFVGEYGQQRKLQLSETLSKYCLSL